MGVEEDLLCARLFRRPLWEIGAEGLRRFRPERTTALFSSFAHELDLGRVIQPEIGGLQVHDLTDPGTRVVQQQQERLVAETGPRAAVHGVEDGLGFRLLQIGHGLVFRAFQGNATDGLTMRQQRGVFPGQESEERPDGRQSGVAGFAAASPDGLQMLQERQHQRFVEVLDTQFFHALLARVRCVAEQ
jgi:hypothetical protein